MVQVGDKIRAELPLYSDLSAMGKPWGKDSVLKAEGEVFYVHPKQRYCQARFQLKGGEVKVTFQIVMGRIQDAEIIEPAQRSHGSVRRAYEIRLQSKA